MLRDEAEKRQKATQAKKGEKIGEHQGASVSQLIDAPKDPNDNRTDAVLAEIGIDKRL